MCNIELSMLLLFLFQASDTNDCLDLQPFVSAPVHKNFLEMTLRLVFSAEINKSKTIIGKMGGYLDDQPVVAYEVHNFPPH